MPYFLANLPEIVREWLPPAEDEDIWLCAAGSAPPLGTPPSALVVSLPAEELTPGLVRAAVTWARELERERQRATEVLATVSHEMRNPVTVLNFMAQLAADRRVKPEQKEAHLATLQSTARNLLTLLNDVLDFAKVGKGAMTLSMAEFSPRMCVEDALLGQRLVAEDKGLTLDGQVAPEVPGTLVGDPGRLRQILTNLTGNAIKFTTSGSVRVEVAWDEPDRLRLSVHDTGIGIAPEQLQRIFEPYAQAAASTQKRYGGTGLGLTITRQLVELMGGSIQVLSQPGQGTTFGCTLRLGRPETVARPTLDEGGVVGLRVLVYGLNPLVWRALEACGVEPGAAEDGEPAAPPVAVFDLSQGGDDPFAAVEQLRRSRPTLKLVVFTTAGQRGDAARCRELGVSAYLTEPLEPQDWRETLALIQGGGEPQLITRHLLRERR